MQTKAVLEGDHYRVTGQKVWSTWAQFADYGYLLARSEPVAGPAGITAFGSGGSGDAIAGLVRLARTCRRSGRPAIADGAVRQDLARFAARAHIQRYLDHTVATKRESGSLTAWDAPLTKIWFSALNLQMSEQATGGRGE